MAANPGSTTSGKDKFSLKPLQLNHKLKPMDSKSWVTFNGEFRSIIDSNALAALKRGKPFELKDVQRILPKANELTLADTLYAFNQEYESASEYIYRNTYANIDFTVPSHGPSLQTLIERTFESERDGIGLYMHLNKTQDRRKKEIGQEDIEKRLTPEAILAQLKGALTPELFSSIAYSIHDDWLRLVSNEGKHVSVLLRSLLRQMKTLNNQEMTLLSFAHIVSIDKPGATTEADSPYASMTAFVDCVSAQWPTVPAGSINVVHAPRRGGPTVTPPVAAPAPTSTTTSGPTRTGATQLVPGNYSPATNKCNTCGLYTCFAGSNVKICQACGTEPAPYPPDATNVQRSLGNSMRAYAKQKNLKNVKNINIGTVVKDMKAYTARLLIACCRAC